MQQQRTYSAVGEPELERRIGEQLRGIVDAVTNRVPTRDVVALVLGGGYGRGEGGALATSGGWEPYNDYDLVLVHTSDDEKRLRAVLEDVGRQQTEATGIHVDIVPIRRDGVAALPPALTWFELAQGHRVLWGDPDALAPLMTRTLAEVDATEWGRLLLNRGCGVLFATWLEQGRPCSVAHGEVFERFCTRQVAKAWLALGDVYLADRGRYSPLVRERGAAWGALDGAFPSWRRHYEAAMEFKLRPVLERSRAELVSELPALRQEYRSALGARAAARSHPLVGLVGTLRLINPARWPLSRPWLYPRERLKRALVAEFSGDRLSRWRLMGGNEEFISVWQSYG